MRWLWTFGRVPEIEPNEMLAVSNRILALPPEQRTSGTAAHIIDVRTQAEFKAGHIPGALNASLLPPWSWPARVEPLLQGLQPSTELYVICLSAHRSIGALKWLQDRGFTNVKQLKGGMQAWRSQRLIEVKELGATDGDDRATVMEPAACCPQQPNNAE
ncbi:hypothetical protein VOLCADRAFT_105722 [Volvox carteri f. nagariensis]|uniref:Rhodanese domain-containing protein n=1 Tax=Volvox carteri f. nagariensis TaxID=3068 RepID=D8U2M1_VOLCA|nr:uncharacterized protein VOLCADRAFT_105722 [Volvox carteri f. nagariensis]EFJ46160.1 hypothetical protein VOLCADRAFT_105722 [Volvox carteri f. nagariensis]|eukprot:XP_002952910.1 hypothetical protein VOLCADRAFT_105722 [Volvox carteri f. nagariensis]